LKFSAFSAAVFLFYFLANFYFEHQVSRLWKSLRKIIHRDYGDVRVSFSYIRLKRATLDSTHKLYNVRQIDIIIGGEEEKEKKKSFIPQQSSRDNKSERDKLLVIINRDTLSVRTARDKYLLRSHACP